MPGGLGAKAFVAFCYGYDLFLTLDQAMRAIRAYMQAWPEINLYFDRIRALQASGLAVLPRSGFARGGLRFTQLANTFFQSLLARGAKLALSCVTQAQDTWEWSPLFGGHVVGFFHDEIMAEYRRRVAAEAARQHAIIMERAMDVYTPDVPSRVEPRIMEHLCICE